jgi:hypothetical protein
MFYIFLSSSVIHPVTQWLLFYSYLYVSLYVSLLSFIFVHFSFLSFPSLFVSYLFILFTYSFLHTVTFFSFCVYQLSIKWHGNTAELTGFGSWKYDLFYRVPVVGKIQLIRILCSGLWLRWCLYRNVNVGTPVISTNLSDKMSDGNHIAVRTNC